MLARTLISGCGGYLPPRVLSNAELAAQVDTSDEWIARRTGIRQRHIADAGVLTSDLAVAAAEAAIADAAARSGIRREDIGFVIVATSTPDNTYPATAARVQARLGLQGGFAFDIQAVCSGFLYALTLADNFIRLGQARAGLVIGAETNSRILDWTDRGTCVLFGDGAGAVVVSAGAADSTRGILSTHLHTDGQGYDLLYVNGGVSSTQTTGTVVMNGREVYRHAVGRMADAVVEALNSNGLTVADVDWLVPHQANMRIMESVAERLGMPSERVVVTVDTHANTSAASIPLALSVAHADGRLKPGDLVVAEALGGGITWGAVALRW
jgi:3-oxoacyl-[acyl-carrier-protein] synthase III